MKKTLVLLVMLSIATLCQAEVPPQTVDSATTDSFDFRTVFNHVVEHGIVMTTVRNGSSHTGHFHAINDSLAIWTFTDQEDSTYDLILIRTGQMTFALYRTGPVYLFNNDSTPNEVALAAMDTATARVTVWSKSP